MKSGSKLHPETGVHDLAISVPPRFPATGSPTGTVDDEDEPEDEHEEENEASGRAMRDGTEAPEEFRRDDEDRI